MKNLRKIFIRLADPQKPFNQRVFVLLSISAFIAAAVSLIGDLIFRDSVIEIITLILTVILVPIVTVISVRRRSIYFGAKVMAVYTVLIVNPVMFFFGGGMEGGGVFWIIFSYIYIGIVLTKKSRVFMLIMHTVVVTCTYIIGAIYPSIIYKHEGDILIADSLISAIAIGLVAYTMVYFQSLLFEQENLRAKDEAKRAEELNRSQNRFFSSMSHEIRTPINSILGLNEIILRQEDISEEVEKDSRNIRGAGNLLLTIINDILDVSKIEAGRMEIIPVDYNVKSLISDTVNMIWLKADEKDLDFEIDIDPSIPTVLFGDEVRIKQILINLLNNAIKYTPEGKVGLHMECEYENNDRIILNITVTDTGIGIRQEAIPYLFNAFQRSDEYRNRAIEGTGLGLSIVKQLVDLMDGKIYVNSVYTKGSTFSVQIPQAVSKADPIGNIDITNIHEGAAVSQKESSFRAPDAKILIVDDNEMNLEVEKKLLDGT
nr:fatty acid-binding protein DegV [Lachnospiraceae bacterium]